MNTCENIYDLRMIYENSIEVQKTVIAKTRIRLREAERRLDFDEMRRLRYVLNILYDEKAELEGLCTSLREYA